MLDFKKVEKEILGFWEKEKIYDKVKKKNKGKKKFYFLQGPPYTSGKLHIGHAWNNSLKDMILRYKRMKGFDVWDRGGYDMHGLPTEHAVQKKLKLKTKDEIEKLGVDKFVKECMNFSLEHAGYMNEDLWKFGVWLDHEGAYMPIKKEFISGQWMFFKKAWEQDRLYKGKKVMHWDAETETSLAKHELEYKNIKDKSVFLKFKRISKDNKKFSTRTQRTSSLIHSTPMELKSLKEVNNQSSLKKIGGDNTYFVIWTTTPWTIPFNLAIMANPEYDYVKIKVENEFWIMAKALVGAFMNAVVGKTPRSLKNLGGNQDSKNQKDLDYYEIVEEFKGEELEGQEYEHFLSEEMDNVYGDLKKEWPKVHTVIMSKEFVDTTAGTGLVHSAPGCGPEDQEACKPYGIGAFNTLNERGEVESLGKYKGWVAKKDDDKFIDEFEKKGVLIATTEIEHEYPHSDRSKQPVIFRTTEQWFLKTEDLADDLLKYNEKVKWVPKKCGVSYDRWAENLRDNGVTRQRYWGCPVPIWVNEKDENDVLVVGSVEELEKLSGKKFKDDLSVHKPLIDKVVIEKNGKKYKRIADVADVWLDSGTTSWNCLDNDPKLIKKLFPADLVLEGTEHTKLWFSMLQICSAVVFGKSCYENVFVHGMMLDFQGTKMSKSLGNVISPYEVVDKYSVDIFRNHICQTTAGININFNWEDVKVKQRNLMILDNMANYILDLERQNPKKGKIGVEEKWLMSKYNSTIKEVSELFEEYKLDETIGKIEEFYLMMSKDYIKYVRDKAGENSAALDALKQAYLGVLKMFSTVCPFVCDYLWQKIGGNTEESVHLCGWPRADDKKIDLKLEEGFDVARGVIEAGLAVRDKEGVGLRWPLAKAEVSCDKDLREDVLEIVKKQLNVKRILQNRSKFSKRTQRTSSLIHSTPMELKSLKEVNNQSSLKEVKLGEGELSVKLDLKLTPELEAEGYAREVARAVQAARKKAGLQKGDLVNIALGVSEKLKKMLVLHDGFLKERVNAKELVIDDKKAVDKGEESFKIKGEEVSLKFLSLGRSK